MTESLSQKNKKAGQDVLAGLQDAGKLDNSGCQAMKGTHDHMKRQLEEVVGICEKAKEQIDVCKAKLEEQGEGGAHESRLPGDREDLEKYLAAVEGQKGLYQKSIGDAEQLTAALGKNPNCSAADGMDPDKLKARKPGGDPKAGDDPGSRNAGNPGEKGQKPGSGQPGQDQQANAGQGQQGGEQGGGKGGGQGGGGGGMPDLSSLLNKEKKEDKCKGMTGQALADCQRGAQTTAGSTGVERPVIQGASSTVIVSRQGAPATKATLKKSAAQIRAEQSKAKLAAQHNRVVEQLTRTPASLDEQRKMSVRHGPHTDMFQAIKGRIREIRARDNL